MVEVVQFSNQLFIVDHQGHDPYQWLKTVDDNLRRTDSVFRGLDELRHLLVCNDGYPVEILAAKHKVFLCRLKVIFINIFTHKAHSEFEIEKGCLELRINQDSQILLH